MSESALVPLNDAERLCNLVRAMPAAQLKVELVDALTDKQLIQVLNVVDEVAPRTWRVLWDRMQAQRKNRPQPEG